MEKKKMAKALVLTAALAGGLSLGESIFNEVQATGGGRCILITSNWTCPPTNLSNCQCF